MIGNLSHYALYIGTFAMAGSGIAMGYFGKIRDFIFFLLLLLLLLLLTFKGAAVFRSL